MLAQPEVRKQRKSLVRRQHKFYPLGCEFMFLLSRFFKKWVISVKSSYVLHKNQYIKQTVVSLN